MAQQIGVQERAYPEGREPESGKKLRAVSLDEVKLFNDDIMNIAAQYGMDSIRAAIAEYCDMIFLLARQVMQEANNPYGGAGALGDQVCIRALRPIDVGIGAAGIAEIWDVDWTTLDPTTTVGDREKIRICSATSLPDTMGEEEGNILFGALIEKGSNMVVNAYRWVKNQKSYPGLTLPFTYCDSDRAQFVKFQAPIIQFTEEALTLYMNVVRASWVYLAIVGIHVTKASNIANTYS